MKYELVELVVQLTWHLGEPKLNLIFAISGFGLNMKG